MRVRRRVPLFLCPTAFVAGLAVIGAGHLHAAPAAPAAPVKTTKPAKATAADKKAAAGKKPAAAKTPAVKLPAARITGKDEGGPQRLVGNVAYTNNTIPTEFRRAVVALLDQGEYYVKRNNAYAAAPAAQVVAPLAGDLAKPPVPFRVDLPEKPAGTPQDLMRPASGKAQRAGVLIYTLGLYADLSDLPPAKSLSPIEQFGATGLHSLRRALPVNAQQIFEPFGGKLLVWSPGAGEAFPSSFGKDNRLFTADDPLVALPAGYTVVTLDPKGFKFERTREVAMPLYEEGSKVEVNLSGLDWVDAFHKFIDLMMQRYAFTELRNVDWNAIRLEYLPRIAAAAQQKDTWAYLQVYDTLRKHLRDNHMRLGLTPALEAERTAAGRVVDIGLSSTFELRNSYRLPKRRCWLTDDGRVIVVSIAEGSAAAKTGILPGAEILEVNGEPVKAFLDKVAGESARATSGGRLAEALDFRFKRGEPIVLKVRQGGADPVFDIGRQLGDAEPAPKPPQATTDVAALRLKSAGGFEFGYLAFDAFLNIDVRLDLYERHLIAFNETKTPGLVIDLRGNRGGSSQLMEQMLSYLFPPERPFRATDYIRRKFDASTQQWRITGPLGLPPELPLAAPVPEVYYGGKVVVLVGKDCASACEFFAYWLQRAGRATVIGTENSSGAGGAIAYLRLPGDAMLQYTYSAELLADGTPYIEAKGVRPNPRVAVDQTFVDAVLAGGDPVLDAAVRYLDKEMVVPSKSAVPPAPAPQPAAPPPAAPETPVPAPAPGKAPPAAAAKATPPAGTKPAPVRYACRGGVNVTMTRTNGNIDLAVGNKHYQLKSAKSDGGFAYTDGKVTWRGKGKEAALVGSKSGKPLAAKCISS